MVKVRSLIPFQIWDTLSDSIETIRTHMFIGTGSGSLKNILPGDRDSIDGRTACSMTVIDEHGEEEFFRVRPMSVNLCDPGRDFPVVLFHVVDSNSCHPLLWYFRFNSFCKVSSAADDYRNVIDWNSTVIFESHNHDEPDQQRPAQNEELH